MSPLLKHVKETNPTRKEKILDYTLGFSAIALLEGLLVWGVFFR